MSIDEEYLQKLMRTLSHDIGAALRAATGLSTLLTNKYDSQLDEKALYWLSLIRTEGEQAQERLKALSRYARLYGIESEKKECDLYSLCEKVVREDYSARYPDFTVSVEPLPIIHGYDFLGMEFFREIVSNSVRHSGVNTCGNFHHIDNQYITIMVQDLGQGIPVSPLDHAILPFRSIGEAGGMGMGMSVAKRIVELHGGEFSLVVDSGLTATARLPKSMFSIV